jgi:competence protein ComEC
MFSPSSFRHRLSAIGHKLPASFLIAALAAVALLTWAAVATRPDDRWHVVFLDVGEGDAIFIQTSNGQKVLVDGGSSPATITNALGRRLPFWDRKLDLVVLTHAHEDHLTGLLEVLQRYQVQQVLEPGYPQTSAMYLQFLQTIQEKRITYRVARAGQRLDLAGAYLTVLHPGPSFLSSTPSDLNNNSVVLRLVIGKVAILLPGDVDEPAQAAILSRGGELASTVLKVPHHGSRTALTADFLPTVSPAVAIVSVGADNTFGHPAPETLEQLRAAGVKVYRTDQNGTIEIITDGTGYTVRTER